MTSTDSSKPRSPREKTSTNCKTDNRFERQNSNMRGDSVHSASSFRSNSISPRKRNTSRSRKSFKSDDHNERLKRVMMKQTILFMISVISSFLFWIFGAQFFQVSLLIPIDTVINAICIWFMFRFADDLWNAIVHCFDCCGCCGGMKEDLLFRMDTALHRISRGMSLHSTPHSHDDAADAADAAVAADGHIPRAHSGHDSCDTDSSNNTSSTNINNQDEHHQRNLSSYEHRNHNKDRDATYTQTVPTHTQTTSTTTNTNTNNGVVAAQPPRIEIVMQHNVPSVENDEISTNNENVDVGDSSVDQYRLTPLKTALTPALTSVSEENINNGNISDVDVDIDNHASKQDHVEHDLNFISGAITDVESAL